MIRQASYPLPVCLLVAAHLTVVSIGLTCPPGTSLIDGTERSWCVRWYSEGASFCNAVKTCHANGEEMVDKPLFDVMRTMPTLFGTQPWWVGLTDALEEQGFNKTGWTWLNTTSESVTNEDDYFQVNEPNDLSNQDCVTTYKNLNRLRDEACNKSHPFYCYLKDPNPSAVAAAVVLLFKPTAIVSYTQPDPGCWLQTSQANTVFRCAFICIGLGADCIGFYWHSGRLQCLIVPYFDASVPLSFNNDEEKRMWRKYLKVL